MSPEVLYVALPAAFIVVVIGTVIAAGLIGTFVLGLAP